jgi:hypothetical protein
MVAVANCPAFQDHPAQTQSHAHPTLLLVGSGKTFFYYMVLGFHDSEQELRAPREHQKDLAKIFECENNTSNLVHDGKVGNTGTLKCF